MHHRRPLLSRAAHEASERAARTSHTRSRGRPAKPTTASSDPGAATSSRRICGEQPTKGEHAAVLICSCQSTGER